MSLPACQQRVLDHIENTLQHREPRLAAMFAMFTRLTGNEGAPRTEKLEPPQWWAAAWNRARRPPVLLIPLTLLLVVSAVLLGIAGPQISCTSRAGPHGTISIQNHVRNCPPGPRLTGFGHGP